MWTTPFLLVLSPYLIADRSDLAQPPEELIDDHGHVNRVEFRSPVDRSRNRVIRRSDLIDHHPIGFDPLTAKLFTKLARQPDLVEPVEDPANNPVDIVVAEDRRDLERNRLGDRLDRIIDLEQSGRDRLRQFGTDPVHSPNGNGQHDDDPEANERPDHNASPPFLRPSIRP
jgi:hypothetical protein